MLELSHWWKSCLGLVMGLLGGCLSLVIGWEYGYTADHYNPRSCLGLVMGLFGGVLDLSHWLEIWIYGGPLQPTNRHKTSCQTL